MTQRIGLDEVRHVASLARLALDEDPALEQDELRTMQAQLGSILESMAALARLDTEGVEPTQHAIAMVCPLRDDEPRPSLRREEVLRAAARSEAGAFAVPKVMEGE
jgi:aspartyl-tRNA(Asn)/glutamyl-tRNA(Gln) amidotransferase subunit C